MKKIAIILLPLIILAAFLAIKPPAVTAGNKPVDNQIIGTDKSTTSKSPSPNQGVAKQPHIKNGKGEDDERHEGKPRYGGHDDDDYDD
jgi:hypothetical protein